MRNYMLLLAILAPVGAFAITPSTGPATPAPTAQQQAPTEETLTQQLIQLQEENEKLSGQLNAEKMKPERIARDKEEVEADIAKMNAERATSAAACSGDNLDPQKIKNILGFTIATLVESGLGTATNVISVVSTLKHFPQKDISGLQTNKIQLGGGNLAKDQVGDGLGEGATKLGVGMAIASTALSAAATVTSAVAHKNLVDLRDDVAACKATFGTWY